MIEAFLEMMSNPAVRALKQRRLVTASRVLTPSSFTHQSNFSMPLVLFVLPPIMVTSVALLTRMPTFPAASGAFQKILNRLRSIVFPLAVIFSP